MYECTIGKDKELQLSFKSISALPNAGYSTVNSKGNFADQKTHPFHFVSAFLELNIAMGLLRLAQIRDYRSRSSVLSMLFPLIMSSHRFQNNYT